MAEDRKDKQRIVEDIIEYLKPYLNFSLYRYERDSKKENQVKQAADNKTIQKEFNTDKVQFELDNVGGDVFSDEIPIIMEE